MKDQWLHDLNRKMEGREESAPEGLWEEIEQKLFEKKEGRVIPLFPDHDQRDKRRNSFPKKNRQKFLRNIGVAAVIVFLLGGSALYQKYISFAENPKENFSQHKTGSNITIKPKNQIKEISHAISLEVENQGINQHEDLPSSRINEKKPYVFSIENELFTPSVVNKIGAGSKKENLTEQSDEVIIILAKMIQENTRISSFPEIENLKDVSFSKSGDSILKDYYTSNKKEGKINSHPDRFSLGFFSGQASPNSLQQKDGYALMSGEPMEDTTIIGEDDDPFMSILSANENQDVNTKIKHKTPVTTGLSIAYSLNEKWSLNTGIIYTRLSSELSSGSEANLIHSTQTLHYIGIPIQANYNIWQKGNFSTYANAGIFLQKSVSGNLKTQYIVDHVPNNGPDEKITIKPLQLSLNTGLGFQYRLYKNFGIYFEPGIMYYFDDGSHVQTIYKEKPLNVSLRFGVRLMIK